MIICWGCVRGWAPTVREGVKGHLLPPERASESYTAMRCFSRWDEPVCPIDGSLDCPTYEGASV